MLAEKSQILCLEVAEVREDRGKIGVRNPKPRRQRRRVLIDRRRRNPATVAASVVGAARSKRGEGSVNGISFDRSANRHLMPAPGVIRPAIRTRLESSAEFGKRKRSHVVHHAEFFRCLVESRDRRTELRI